MMNHSPNLTLLLGRAGTGKTHQCLEEFRGALESAQDSLEPGVLFVLPNLEHRERIVNLLLRRNVKGFFGRAVTTFDELFASLIRFSDTTFASQATRHLILRELIAGAEFTYFKEAAGTKGFVDLLSRWIGELKESLVSAKEFRESLLPVLLKRFPSAESKYLELAALYETYEQKLLQSNLRDRQDAFFLLEEGLRRGEFHPAHFRHIWIDGFFDFSNLQLAFIEFLTRHSEKITVTLTSEEDHSRGELFQTSFDTMMILRKAGFSITSADQKFRRSEDEALRHLEASLFSEEVRKKDIVSDSVRIFEAAGIRGEIEMIAREIKKLMLGGALHYSDIALIFRQAGPYLSLIRSVFSAFEIPVEIHEREELKTHPLAQTILSLVRIFLEDWNREDLLNFFKSGFVKTDSERIAQMELSAMAKGIRKTKTRWLEAFPFDELKKLSLVHEMIQAGDSAKALCRILRNALFEFGLNDLADDLSEKNKLNHAAFERICLLFDEIEFKYADGPMTFERFADIFMRLVEIDLFSFHLRDKNRVQVYNVSLARQKEYKVVFVPALLEKQFPVQVKEDPVFSDEERRAINSERKILKERLPRQLNERFFFYLALTRARERLILSYPRFDLEGKEALPSFYVDEVKALFQGEIPKEKQEIGDVLPKPGQISNKTEAEAHVISTFWQPPVGKHHSTHERLAAAFYNAFIKEDEIFGRTISKLLLPPEGRILDERVKSFFHPPGDVFSPSRLEEYAECPYRFFAHQVLNLEEFDDEIDIRAVGRILHRILEKFHLWAAPRGVENIPYDEALQKCAVFLDDAFKEDPLEGSIWYRIELKKKEISETIRQILYQEMVRKSPPLPGLRPAHFEAKFGFQPDEDYLILKDGESEIKFRGQIDRIDVDPSGKFGLVIDYKTGKPFKIDSLQKGTELQLPIYLLAAERKFGLKPIGAYLYQLSQAKSSGFHHKDHLNQLDIKTKKRNHFTPSEWQGVFDRISRFIFRFVSEIKNAQIPVKPRDCVKFCPYQSVCRIEKWRLDSIYEEIAEEDKKMFENAIVGATRRVAPTAEVENP